MSEPTVLWDATFDKRVKSYYLCSTSLVLCITIVGIPLALIYILIGNWLIDKHLRNLGCTLNQRTLEIKKGILNKTESTIPLEKITDLQMFQGPIMRHFGLRGFKVETAGQSSGPGGSLVNIIGIVDAVEFRRAVLDQRDKLANSHASQSQSAAPATSGTIANNDIGETLVEIRDLLARIESKMDDS
tara:strand:+ start:143398 stop:143958 length:561 start_codon:yes stop_codon:yes gene_type:complete